MPRYLEGVYAVLGGAGFLCLPRHVAHGGAYIHVYVRFRRPMVAACVYKAGYTFVGQGSNGTAQGLLAAFIAQQGGAGRRI